MANLLDFYFEQLVQESDLDQLQANFEAADRALMSDQAYIGVVSGFGVVEHAPIPDLTVDIGGPGKAYDQEGRRIFMPSSVTLDVSVDSGGSPTAVANPGNEKWVSVVVQFERVASDLRFGNGVPVYYRQDEGYSFVVVQGAEAASGTATRPGLLPDALLIADFLLAHGDTQIEDAAIESADVVTKPNSRFEWIFNLTASAPASIRVGPIPQAMQGVLTELNTHIANLGNAHPGTAITFTPVGDVAWADFKAATQVTAALNGIVADLSDQGIPGASLVGVDRANLANWKDGTPVSTAVATDIEATLDRIVTDLAGIGPGFDGAGKVGFDDLTFSTRYASVGSVADALDDLAQKATRIAAAETVTGAWDFSAAIDFDAGARIDALMLVGIGNGAQIQRTPRDAANTASSWTFLHEGTQSPLREHGFTTTHTLGAGITEKDLVIWNRGGSAVQTTVVGVEGDLLFWDDSSNPVDATHYHFTGALSQAAGSGTVLGNMTFTPTLLNGGADDFASISLQSLGSGQMAIRTEWGANAGLVKNFAISWRLMVFSSAQ